MKYFNKKLINSKKKNIYFKKGKYLPLLLIIFFLGIWTERFDYKTKVKNFSYEIVNTISNASPAALIVDFLLGSR